MAESICVFGDSVCKGVVFDSALAKYRVLKDSFIHLLEKAGNMVINNYSKFGCTVTRGSEILTKHESELRNYDYTVLEFGGNDCDYDWAAVAAEPDAFHVPKTPVDDFKTKYAGMVEQIKDSGGNPALLSLPPIDAKRYFNWISRGLNADNILRFLGDVEFIYRWHEMYNLAVCSVAMEHHVPLIDISSVFLKTGHYQNYICEDGIHPNEQGHKLIEKEIFQYVLQTGSISLKPQFAS